jgi:high-affinity iron transporter
MMSWSLALQSGSILLREGIEAMLIIAALAAFLRRSSAQQSLTGLYLGAGLAILASLAGAVVMALFFNGAHNDQVEAAIMLLAAVLMLYMSGWLFLKQDPKALMGDLKRSVDKAVAGGSMVSFAALSFLAVFREGGETVLFLHALAQTSGGWSVSLIGGLIAAAAALVVLYIAMQWFALRLPVRPLFLVTSAFLFVMALKFIGQAVQEVQELTLVPVTPADLPEMLTALGFNASWEALGVQAIIALVALGSTAWAYVDQQRRQAAMAATPVISGVPAE